MSESTELSLPNTLGELKKINLSSLKAKSAGLSILLFSLGERSARRISKLQSFMEKTEDYLFDEETIEHLSPEDQMERYKLAAQMLQTSGDFIRNVAVDINIDDLETKILLLENQMTNASSPDSPETGNLQALAENILKSARRIDG